MRHTNKVITKDNDIFVVSYPRSGNYWLRFMLATYLHDIDIHWNNFKEHCPMVYHVNEPELFSVKEPRVLGSHDTYVDVPNSVYIYRDPRDVVISQYFYNLKRGHTDGQFDDFFDSFVNGEVEAFGTWRENVESWVERADYTLSYSDMQDNATKQLEKILSYFNLKIDFEKINHSVHWCRFENMKKLEKEQRHLKQESEKDIDFLRKGKSKQWEDFLSDEQKKIMKDTYGDLMEKLGYL